MSTRDDETSRARQFGARWQVVVPIVVVAAIALTAAISLTRHAGTQSSAPTPLPRSYDDLPVGALPRVPYLHDRSLHVGTTTIPTTADSLYAAGDAVIVSTYHPSTSSAPAHNTYEVLRNGRLVAVGFLPRDAVIALGPRGDVVAIASITGSRAERITATDPRTGTEIAHVDVRIPPYAGMGDRMSVAFFGFDGHDRVHFTANGREVLAWWPGHGSPHVSQGDPAVTMPVSTADGRLAVRKGTVIDHTTGARTSLALPRGTYRSTLAFESEDAVLVDIARRGSTADGLVRCDTHTGTCERAGDIAGALEGEAPFARGWILPRLQDGL